jgi:penicillin-binding protein 1A
LKASSVVPPRPLKRDVVSRWALDALHVPQRWVWRQVHAGPRRWALLLAYVLLGLSVMTTVDVVFGMPGPGRIGTLTHMPQATRVYDVNGQLAFTIFKERRIVVPLSEVSPHVVEAVLAIEDQRFYTHRGIDLWRIGGALVANVRRGDRVQGGSTITQQLARQSFLTGAKTIRRKLKEAILAIRIERQYTKDQILEHYLNKVYFGNGLHGIEAAARGYFGKPAKDLGVAEAALLAGLIQAPSRYAPTVHLERAIARRAIVLGQMAQAGFIDEATAAKLSRDPVKVVNGFGDDRWGQYFRNHVMRVLAEQFGWERLSEGGLNVFSTIDPGMQAAAERALARGLDQTEKLPSFKHPRRGDPRTTRGGQSPDYLQGALVALDPVTGEVRAMVGGRDFDESQFDRATQGRRQAGSAFKPFVYAAAIEAGYTAATLLSDLNSPIQLPSGAWLPQDGHATSDAMTVRTALRTSSNRAAVRMLRAVGISAAVTYARRLGLEAPPVPSLVLGSGDVSVLSMAAAYAAFANGGWLHQPVFIRRVEDADGRVLLETERRPSRAVSQQTAFLIAQILADVVNAGTGWRARAAGFRFAAGGKTGTTNDYRDAWFVGFTPALVTSVWLGFDQPKPIVPGGYAGELAAPIWGQFMQQAAGRRDAGWLPRPQGVVAVDICRESGALPSPGCYRTTAVDRDGGVTERSSVGSEYFRSGTEPVAPCPIHGTPFASLFGIARGPIPR